MTTERSIAEIQRRLLHLKRYKADRIKPHSTEDYLIRGKIHALKWVLRNNEKNYGEIK